MFPLDWGSLTQARLALGDHARLLHIRKWHERISKPARRPTMTQEPQLESRSGGAENPTRRSLAIIYLFGYSCANVHFNRFFGVIIMFPVYWDRVHKNVSRRHPLAEAYAFLR